MGICNSRLKKLTSYIEPQECRKEILKNDGEKHEKIAPDNIYNGRRYIANYSWSK